MTKNTYSLCLILALVLLGTQNLQAQFPRFKVLAFYSTSVEPDHVDFARDAIRFFQELTIGDGFVFDTSSNMDDLIGTDLMDYSVVMMLNDFPHNQAQREAFMSYMENGGGWYGFHVSAYNDRGTGWPWLNEFLGCGTFYRNNWPPMPAKLLVDDRTHPVTRALPEFFISPINEWYQWDPSPRLNDHVKVLVSLSSENYPFGLKDIIYEGDFPVVWTNTNYRMIYMNMGHGRRIFSDATQNMLFIEGLRWLVQSNKKGKPPW